jgi:hypothetical protein
MGARLVKVPAARGQRRDGDGLVRPEDGHGYVTPHVAPLGVALALGLLPWPWQERPVAGVRRCSFLLRVRTEAFSRT